MLAYDDFVLIAKTDSEGVEESVNLGYLARAFAPRSNKVLTRTKA